MKFTGADSNSCSYLGELNYVRRDRLQDSRIQWDRSILLECVKIVISTGIMEAMARTTLRAKGQITLPDKVRRAAHLEEGDLFEAEITNEGILLRPLKLIDANQAWFWTVEWQNGERDADANLDPVGVTIFPSGVEMLDSLRMRSKTTRQRKKL